MAVRQRTDNRSRLIWKKKEDEKSGYWATGQEPDMEEGTCSGGFKDFDEYLIGPVTELIKCLAPPVARTIGYVVHPDKYVEQIRSPMEELAEKRMQIQRSVDLARRRGEVIKEEVEHWLKRVDRLQTEVTVLRDAIQGKKGCFQGGCSVRYHVGKEASKKIIYINDIRNEGQFGAVSDPAPPPGIESMPTPDFESFQSTEFAMKEIMRSLEDENINLVGVYGMGGVGKTTMMKELGKGVKRNGLFDQVMMITVSQHSTVKKIQEEIAENLGIRLEEESETVRGRRLSDRMKQDERILLILDDLWAPLELANIGVPVGDDLSKWCKVVLTTRSLEVCNLMRTQAEIEVRVLSEPDGWSLFQKNVGDFIASAELHTMAREVARECGGLPIALVTLGRALRNKDPTVWADTARRLKRSSAIDIAGMNATVFSSIRLSYDFLDDEEAKFCFLLCCLFPEDHEISEDALFPYIVGERVFIGVESLMEARDRLHTVLDKLQALCLLVKAGNGCAKMHDVVRDVAIEIAKEEHGFEVKACRGLEQWQDMESGERCKRLSLMKNNINKLSNGSDYFQLLTLSLQDNWLLEEIPDKFFQGMTSLTTLDLSFTSICSFPASISCLKNLRVLDMARDAYSVQVSLPLDLSLLGNLKKLEILNLENCDILNLPEEIGGLTELKLLNLSGNERLSIPPNVVSQLSHLEELDMYCSFDNWEIEESKDGCKAYLSEVASLIDLTKLRLGIADVKCLSAFVPVYWKNLTQFSITVGDIGERLIVGRLFFNHPYDTHMGFCGLVVPEELPDLFRMLFGRTEDMIFQRCNGLKNVLQVVKIYGGFNSLKALKFDSCCDLEYLLNAEVEKAPEIAFNSLEVLELYALENLKEISRGPLPDGYFNKLSSLHLELCGTLLTNVLHSGLIARLPNLERLYVFYCSGLTEIFNSEGLKGEHAPMMKLQVLKLWELHKLVTIWKGAIPYGSLQNIISIDVCGMERLKYLFSPAMVERLQKLERLDIYWCDEMVQIISIDEEGEEQAGADPIEKCRSTTSSHTNLSDSLSKPNFHNLRFLDIFKCPKLKHFLPLNLAQCLLQLEQINISLCNGMEEIFAVNLETETCEDKMTLPKLKTLKLKKLPKLFEVVTSSSQGDILLDFPSLGTLHIKGCPNLKSLSLDPQNPPPTDIKGDWIALEEMNKIKG